MTASPLAAALAQTPDPPQDRAAASASSLTTHMLAFVRKLIDYGKEVANALPQNPAGEARIDLQIRFGIQRFGPKSILRILAQILHALRLAASLEDRLAGRPARRHATVELCPRAAAVLPSRRAPRTAKTKRRLHARTPFHLPIDSLPLMICSELGICYGDALWQEMDALIDEHHDALIKSSQQTLKQWTPATAFAPDINTNINTPPVPRARPALHLVSVATTATGPP